MISALHHLIFHDFWLKLFSVGLAVLIWFTISFAIRKDVSPVTGLALVAKERTFANLPISVLSSAAEPKAFRVQPSEVEVTVRGDARVVNNITSKDIRVLVDLTGIEDAHDLRKRIEVVQPAGITHVAVFPQEVEVLGPKK